MSAIAGVVGFLGTALASLTASKGGHTALLIFKIVFVTLGTVLLVLALRSALSWIRADRAGITVVNPLSRRKFAWDEIERFSLGRWSVLPRVCLVVLIGGATYHAWGLSGRNPGLFRRDPRVERPVAELNRLLAESRS